MKCQLRDFVHVLAVKLTAQVFMHVLRSSHFQSWYDLSISVFNKFLILFGCFFASPIKLTAVVSKYPKSTKYGWQNPVTARWNSEEQLVLWRSAWADTVNRCLERFGHEERVDHRSHAERGLDEQPTIHEGVAARAMEKKGIISDRCELNRQIKADNDLLRELKSAVKKLMDAVKNTIPAIAEAMETVRQKMIIFRYHLLHIKSGKTRITNTLQIVKPDIKRYEDIVEQLKGKIRERRPLLEEKKALAAIHVFRH